VGQRRLHELSQFGTGHARTRSSVGTSRKHGARVLAIRSISLGYSLTGYVWRVYFLQRGPSTASLKRVKQRVQELTPRAACHTDPPETIAKLNPVLRGWGNYFATGNAAIKFNQVDSYVWMRVRKLV